MSTWAGLILAAGKDQRLRRRHARLREEQQRCRR